MKDILQVISGILVPFFGTTAGAAVVFFLRKNISDIFNDILSAFAAGIMTAASIWSLLIPASERCAHLGRLSFLPIAIGFMLGIFFMWLLSSISRNLLSGKRKIEKLTTALAVTIHNFPEGMAVGTIYAAYLAGEDSVSLAAAFVLALGIAIQNIPEGAIISMPLHGEGVSKFKSFLCGTLSGVVEPLGAIITISAITTATALLPYLLSFAAGTMIFVVTEQLIPDIKTHGRVPIRALSFGLGFALMMSLDIALS